MHPVTSADARTVITRGFSRARYALVLGIVAAAIALFVLWSLNIGHGLYAFVVLTIAVIALVSVGGPERLARTITVTPDEIRITRFHRIGTLVARSDLQRAVARSVSDRRGRTRVELVLTPHDPASFFTQHRELRSVRVGDAAHVPAGRSEPTVGELTEALTLG